MGWVSNQFTTRVIVLIPVAIAINIVLGYTVQTVLKMPIYLDSIGTIFVGVLAGPVTQGPPLQRSTGGGRLRVPPQEHP